MIIDPRTTRVYVYRTPVDMRKGHNGLSALVMEKMRPCANLLSGSIFFFVSRNRKAAKALMWDETGLVVFHKRMERGRIMGFERLLEGHEITCQQLMLIMAGAQVVLDVQV